MDVALGRLLAAKAWRTALGTAQKRRWIGPSNRFCLRWTPIEAIDGFRGLRVVEGLERVERLDGFKGLGAGERQAWTPIRSH